MENKSKQTRKMEKLKKNPEYKNKIIDFNRRKFMKKPTYKKIQTKEHVD